MEEKYEDQPFKVIGVNSVRFVTEKERESIESAITEYDIKYPVVMDSRYRIMKSYGVHLWPTFILIGRNGKIIEKFSGTENIETLDKAISHALENH